MPIFATAQNARGQLLAKKQSALGTAATGNFNRMRVSGFNFNAKRGRVESDELRPDREVQDVRHGFGHGMGEVTVDLVHGEHDLLLEAAMFNVFTTNTMTIGTAPSFYSFEDAQADINVYRFFQDMMCSRMEISATPGGAGSHIKAKFDFVGVDGANAGTTAGGVPVQPSEKKPFMNISGGIYDTADLLGGELAHITGFTLIVDNGGTPLHGHGQQGPVSLGYSKGRVSGTLTAYLLNATLLDRFKNETETAVVIKLADPAANELTFTMGRVKYMDVNAPVSADGPRIITVPFDAQRDTTQASALKITKTA